MQHSVVHSGIVQHKGYCVAYVMILVIVFTRDEVARVMMSWRALFGTMQGSLCMKERDT